MVLKTLARRVLRALMSRAPAGTKDVAVRMGERIVGRHRLHGEVPGRAGARFFLSAAGHKPPFLLTGNRLAITGWALDLVTGEPLRLRARIGRRVIAAEACERPDLAAAFRPLCTLPTRCGVRIDGSVRAGPSILSIEVEIAPDRWIGVTRLLVLATGGGGLFRALVPDWRYVDRRRHLDALQIAQAGEQRAYAEMVGRRPAFEVLVETRHGGDLAATLTSLAAQTYPAARVTPIGTVDGAADFRAALAASDGDLVVPLRAGDRLAPGALYRLAAAAHADSDLDLVYADEDCDAEGSPAPVFKPDWSPDTLEAYDVVGAPAAYRGTLARTLPAESAYDLALRVTETSGRVHHVAEVLCRRAVPATQAIDREGDIAALAGRLARTGRRGAISPIGPGLAAYDCRVAVAGTPLVSIVMPTAARVIEIDGRRIDLVVNCVESIRTRASYRNVEFILIKNDDMPPETEARLLAIGCRMVAYREPVFNVARKLNLGIAQARGEFIVLMNDDIEVVATDWLERMIAQAQKPHVGVVGAKLVYTHGALQHAGIVLLHGNPSHVRHHYPREDLGYVFSTCAPRNYMAVTGACTMARADVVRRVGGYTEALAINFNDVDFCLKVRELGLPTVYEPGCELIHFESASRVPVLDRAEVRWFVERWGATLDRDPYYDGGAFAIGPPVFEPFMGPIGVVGNVLRDDPA